MPHLTAAVVICVLMLSLWLVSVRLRDVSIIDIVWGLGFVLVAWSVLIVRVITQTELPGVLLAVLVTIWGLRLTGHLFRRNHGKPEDYRYRQMRDHWGQSFWWISLVTVFVLQGVIMWIVSLPVQMANATKWPVLALIGAVTWTVGMVFEAVGDWQLTRFRSNPQNLGKVLDDGLWRYTRHPNYFGDFLVWWGHYLVALSCSAPWWTIISPLLMSLLLMRVSGVALLEKSLILNKPNYADYIRRTSTFFPRRPKKGSQIH